MDLRTLLAPFGIDAPAIELEELVLDSREVAIHKAFVAVAGHQLDGRDFIPQAISLGAKAIIAGTDDPARHGQLEMREHSAIIEFYGLSQQLSALAAHFYGHPADKLDVIAVTGTNGKTSTAMLSSQLRQLLGQPAGLIGTLGAGLLNDLTPTINTTPDAISMQGLLAKMLQQGATQVALEASSHALVQGRINALTATVAIFTNLTRDHLDYHGTMEEYARAKRLLLQQPGLQWAVINGDDAESQNWLAALPEGVKGVVTAVDAEVGDAEYYCVAKDIRYLSTGCQFTLKSNWGQAQISLPLLGAFNIANFLAAIASQLCLGAELPQLAAVANQVNAVAGRMEIFHAPQCPTLVVDYAHTPDALEQALKAMRKHAQGKLWCIFGCGGDRDKGKRPLMGAVAEEFADKVMLTNDNSRSEDPLTIAEDILAGCKQPQAIEQEMDRKLAISKVLEQAEPDDLILVAGKGHEDYQIISGQRIAYDERQYVTELLKGKGQ